jgi:hypothetical protein
MLFFGINPRANPARRESEFYRSMDGDGGKRKLGWGAPASGDNLRPRLRDHGHADIEKQTMNP